MKATIFNIQKFSIHDGPGIRTVVFFKGCPLRCHWCSNPESQTVSPQLLWNRSQCTRCHSCEAACPTSSIRFVGGRLTFRHQTCSGCLACVQLCPAKALEYSGKHMDIDTVISEVKKDIDFYEESGGGVTLSGGEVLVWHEFAARLLDQLRREQIHSAIETTGYAEEAVFQKVASRADLLLYDLKHYDPEKHREFTGVSNERIIANMNWAVGQKIPVIARIPVIPGVNAEPEDADRFCTLLHEIGITRVRLLPFHQFGQGKYETLQIEYLMKNTDALHPEDLRDYQQIFEAAGFDVKL